jgi:hypothetical protein
MSETDRIDVIVAAIVRNFDLPPNEEYSTYDFGVVTAATLSESELSDLTCAVLQRTSDCIAMSFLDGALSTRRIADPSRLYEALQRGYEVKTASGVVELLVTKHHLRPDEVAEELLRRLSLESVAEVQNRLAFGLWSLFCGERFVVADEKTVGYLVSSIDDAIDRQLDRTDLSPYARDTLRVCRSNQGRG